MLYQRNVILRDRGSMVKESDRVFGSTAAQMVQHVSQVLLHYFTHHNVWNLANEVRYQL